jgi:hypothetical protein
MRAILVSVRRYDSSECGRGWTKHVMRAMTSHLFIVVAPSRWRSGTAVRMGLEGRVEEVDERACLFVRRLGRWFVRTPGGRMSGYGREMRVRVDTN